MLRQELDTYLPFRRKYYLCIQMHYGGDTMKKAMVYMIALTLAFSTMLAGCGEMRGTDKGTPTPTPTISPDVTFPTETMMPNPEDGEVRDRDGIITDGDSGAGTGGTVTQPGTTKKGTTFSTTR